MLQALELPPGIYRNGTDLQSAGRWRDASLVRWHNGAMQPVGGWRTRLDNSGDAIGDIPTAAGSGEGVPRGALSWMASDGTRWIAVGSYADLWVVEDTGTATTITPSGFTDGNEDAALQTGYGEQFYGNEAYGVSRSDSGTYSEATTWSLDTWGEYLVGCTPQDGKLYEWQLNVANPAAAITNAPTSCLGLMVTAERFLFALGAGGNPRKVQWCDREDNTTWTAAATNEAGSQILETDSQIMCGISVRGQSLILTETDAHVASYVGPPFVYGFERVGTSCGPVSRKSVVEFRGGAAWMGTESFFVYDGGAAQDLPCEVGDYVFRTMNAAQGSKVYAVANQMFNEIWWFYPGEDSTECNRYVAWNYEFDHWMIGEMARTCGVDRGAFQRPIWLGSDGSLYDHEIGLDRNDETIFAESGPLILGGGTVVSATSLLPDELTQGDVTVTFKTRFYPNDTERDYGPYTMAAPTSVRFTGRQVRMKVNGSGLKDWRFGIPRLDVVERGKR